MGEEMKSTEIQLRPGEILTERRHDGVIIQMRGTSIDNELNLLSSVLREIRARLEVVEFEKLSDNGSALFHQLDGMTSEMQDRLEDFDNEVCNGPAEDADLGWLFNGVKE